MRRLVVCGLMVIASVMCGGRGPIFHLGEDVSWTLPIEVIGKTDAERLLSLRLTIDEGPPAKILMLQTHGIDKAGKASLSINGGAERPLDNSTVTVAEPGKSFGGIGGGFATLTFYLTLSPDGLAIGENTLRFRFTADDGSLSVGYRILSFNLLDETGRPLLDAKRFRHEEPRSWLPPVANGAPEGERIWSQTPLPSAAGLHCADCHTHDGRDLAYYAFSNDAITAKAQRMGLSARDGTLIASYIRTIAVTPWGRPWNPPYQPGPELDLRPLQSWAAGAGVEASLPRDRDALPLLFRGGLRAEAVATSGRLNVRELPIVLQLLDWNRWLPPKHPAQVWGRRFTQHPAFTRYLAIRDRLAQGGKNYARGAMPADLEAWASAWNSTFVGEITAGLDDWPPELAADLYAGGRWRMVKMWELMQEFDLESIGGELYAPQGESRTWFSRTGFAANTSPDRRHVVHPDHDNPWLIHRYLESAWRHLGLVLNPGNRRRFNFTPFPFGDAIGDLHLLHERSGVPELTRLSAVLVKGMQEMDNGLGPGNPSEGWSFGEVIRISTLVSPQFEPMWMAVSAQERAALTEALVRAWWVKTRSFPTRDWPRGTNNQVLAPSTYRPTIDTPRDSAVDEFFLALPRLRAVGVDADLMNEIKAWALEMWPNGAW